MASGNTLAQLTPLNHEPPSSSHATLNLRNGHPVLQFDAAAAESAVFTLLLPRHYSGGGLTVTLMWAGSSGNVVWEVAIERLEDEGTDTDADSFATAQSATAAAPATSGALQYTSIAFTNGAQMDSAAAGELMRIKVTRDATNGSDTMTGDADLMAIEIKET